MQPEKQLRYNLVVFLIYFSLSLFSFHLIFGDGPIAIRDLAPVYKLDQLYRPFDFPWDHWSNLGIPNFFIGNVIYNVPLIMLSVAAGSVVLAHKLLFCLILAFAGFGFFLAFMFLMKSTKSRVGAFAAGLSYMFNPWSLNRIICGHNTICLGYTILPYAFLLYLKCSEGMDIKYILTCGLLSSLLFLTSPHMAYLFFILIFFYGVFDIVNTKAETFNGRLKRQSFLILAILALNIAFSSPVLYHTYKIDIPLYVVREEETAYYAINLSSLTPTNVLYIFLGVSLVFWGVTRLRRERHTAYFLFPFLCGLGLLLASGGLWPIKPLYMFLFSYVPGFFIFTEASRFLFFPVVAIAFFLGYSIDKSFTCEANFLHVKSARVFLKQMKRLLTNNLLTMVLLLLTFSATWQFFTGDMGGEVKPVHFPDHFMELDDWLRRQEGDFRIAFFPPACWATEYNWASGRFIDPVAALPAQPTIELKSERDLTLASSFVRWVYTSIYRNKTAHWGKLLGLMGVKYVIVRRDADMSEDRDDLRQFSLQNTLKILLNSKDLLFEKAIGPLLIYRNPYCLPHIFCAKGISLIAGDRRTLITLSYLPSLDFIEQPVAFVDNGVSLLNMLPYLRSIIIEGDRYWDLMLSSVDESCMIKPWEHVKPSVSERVQWIKGDFSWYFYDGNIHVAPDNYIITNGKNNIVLPFTIQEHGLYKVLAQVFETPHPDFLGIKFKVDSSNEEVRFITRSPRLDGSFRWVQIGDYELDAGRHSILVTSLGGAAAISKVAVIPNSSIGNIERNILETVDASNTSLIHLFDDYTWSRDSTSELQIFLSSNYSNGQAMKLSKGKIEADFYVLKSGHYMPFIRISNDNPRVSALKIIIDDSSTVLYATPDSSAGFHQLKPIRLEQGHHRMGLMTHENYSSFLVDNVILHYLGSGANVECALNPSELATLNIQQTPRILQLGIIIDPGFNATHINQLISFINGLPNFTHYNFVIGEWNVLNNATFVDYLGAKGEFIPMFSYEQTNNLSMRVSKADVNINTFKETVGYYPNGSFMFQPDTYVLNYMKDKYGMNYVHGYCFDQWIIDWMTMRGSWQAPFYGSYSNVYVPSPTRGGIVVIPHVTWDWVARFTKGHSCNTHPTNAYQMYNNWSLARTYVVTLINRTLDNLKPYGYAKTEFEFRSAYDHGYSDDIKILYEDLIERSDVTHMTNSELVSWLSSRYAVTPTYTMNFTSPADDSTIEWYFSNKYRIARVGDYVRSFVDYTKQGSDPYLNSVATIDFRRSWDTDNDVDTSLKYEIDALSGGTWNPTPKDSGVTYRGSLSSFPEWHYRVGIQPINPIIYVKHSGSLYEVYPKNNFLVFLEAKTRYWELQSEGGTEKPFTVFGYANAFQLDKDLNAKHNYSLVYLGLTYFKQGLVLSVFFTIIVLLVISYIRSHCLLS